MSDKKGALSKRKSIRTNVVVAGQPYCTYYLIMVLSYYERYERYVD